MESRLLPVFIFCLVFLRPMLADEPASSEVTDDSVSLTSTEQTEVFSPNLPEDEIVETSTGLPTTTEQPTTEEIETTTEQATTTTTEEVVTTTTEPSTTTTTPATNPKPTTPKTPSKGPLIIFFFLPKRRITRTNIQHYLRKLKNRRFSNPMASSSQIYETIVPAPPSLGPDLANSESGYFPAYYPYPYRAEDYYHQTGSTRSRLDQDYYPQHPNLLGSGNFDVVRGGVFSHQASAEQSRRDFTHQEYDDDDDYDDDDEDDDKFADFDSFASRVVTQVDDPQVRRPAGGSASQLIPITTVLEAMA